MCVLHICAQMWLSMHSVWRLEVSVQCPFPLLSTPTFLRQGLSVNWSSDSARLTGQSASTVDLNHPLSRLSLFLPFLLFKNIPLFLLSLIFLTFPSSFQFTFLSLCIFPSFLSIYPPTLPSSKYLARAFHIILLQIPRLRISVSAPRMHFMEGRAFHRRNTGP